MHVVSGDSDCGAQKGNFVAYCTETVSSAAIASLSVLADRNKDDSIWKAETTGYMAVGETFHASINAA